jgi:sugar fermentation stimulation protein A
MNLNSINFEDTVYSAIKYFFQVKSHISSNLLQLVTFTFASICFTFAFDLQNILKTFRMYMNFFPHFERAYILRRYKRFFVDIELLDGTTLTVHCPNTGSMTNCWAQGNQCWFSRTDNPNRKLPGTLELTKTTDGYLCGINTQHPNNLVVEAIENGVINELQGYENIYREVKYGAEKSRIDILLTDGEKECYVEVKNMTFNLGNGHIVFPDAKTTRGVKHLCELTKMVQQGSRSMLIFCVQHSGACTTGLAKNIDPLYVETMRNAINAGVEVVSYSCSLSPEKIIIEKKLPFIF